MVSKFPIIFKQRTRSTPRAAHTWYVCAADQGGAAELVISPDGRFVYATIRSTGAFSGAPEWAFNLVATLEVDPEHRTLRLLDNCDTGGNMPWTMSFARDGKLLLVQNQHARHDGPDGGENDGTNGSGEGGVTIFQRDEASGKISRPKLGLRLNQCMGLLVVENWPLVDGHGDGSRL